MTLPYENSATWPDEDDIASDPRNWIEQHVEVAREALEALQILARGYPHLFRAEASHLAALGLGFGNLAHWAAEQKERK